ncbi:glycosyltransferase family 4 protein [Paenibacillus larvae]
MKIIQLITRSDSIGGAQMHVLELSRELQRQGHEVLVAVGGNGPFIPLLQEHGIPVRCLPDLIRPIRPWTDFKAFHSIRKMLKEVKPDLLATHSSKAGWLGRLAGKLGRIPTLFTAHSWAFTEGVPFLAKWLYIAADLITAPMADKIINVSHFDYMLAKTYRVAKESKMTVIHNGITDLGKPLLANPEAIPPRFVMVSRMERPKDHLTLLKAVAPLAGQPWKIDFMGAGPKRKELEELVNDWGLSENIRFLGQRKDIAEQLASSQGLLLISEWEGLPICIVEALRAGLPVIATGVGGVPELVYDRINGFLIPRGDATLLRSRFVCLCESPSLRREMGQAGRRFFEEYFTDKQMFAKVMRVYEETVRIQKGSSSHPANA